MTTKIYSTDPIPGFTATTLTGHKDTVVGAWFTKDMRAIYTVSKDGAVCVRTYRIRTTGSEDLEFGHEFPMDPATGEYEKTIWFIKHRYYFGQETASLGGLTKVQCAEYHAATGLLLAGFSNGVFGIWEMPDFNMIHTLSISQNKITTVAVNPSGEWLAFGVAKLGQLLVWEWQSESYVLKQQGHYYDVSAVAYSGDGQYIVTGGDDGKVKVWNASTGYCFVTFSEHAGGITAVGFTKGNQ
ncbi:U3 snoRNP protein, partial [Spiromyces aspiralis]